MVIIAILAFLSGTYFNCQQVNNNEGEYVSKRPNIKIKTPYLKIYPYATSDGGQSMALTFYIPIRNDGNVTAYNVEIKRKDISLVRGSFHLDNSSLKSEYTCAPFDLKPKGIIEDTIFIDESPTNMQKIVCTRIYIRKLSRNIFME